MTTPYLDLIADMATYGPPLDRNGFEEILERINVRVTAIPVRPRKADMRAAIEAICRAQANVRFAELGLKTRF